MHSTNRSFKIFYGWWVVAAAFFISFYVAGTINYGFTSLFEPIADEMGWSYTQISLAFSLRGLEIGILAPFIGALSDRWGPRKLIFAGAIIAFVGLILLGRATSLAMFYGAFVLISIGVSGGTMTVLMTAVANWFHRRIGLASGIAICGYGASGLLVPVLVRLVDIYGWRQAVTIVAFGLLAVVLPLSLLIRHKPEQYGTFPDGQAEEPAITPSGDNLPRQVVEERIKVRQILKNGIFWRIALISACHALINSAIVAHVMPYLGSIGMSRARASLVATTVPVISISGRLGLGWIGDKVDRRWVTAVAFALISLGVFCFAYASFAGVWLVVPFIVCFGVGYGGTNTLRVALVREYFGRASFGMVFGLVIGIGAAALVVSPTLAGWVYDTWGSYQGIWFIYAGLPLVTIISLLTMPRAEKARLT